MTPPLRLACKRAAYVMVALALGLGCSSSDDGDDSGFLGSDAGDKPQPQGAFSVTFGNATAVGVTCPATSPTAQLQVGVVSSTQLSPVVNGADGASVSCKVSQSGTGFKVNGSIIQGTSQFSLAELEIGEGTVAEGTISVVGATTGGKTYAPEIGTPCSFQIIDAAQGRVWMHFECPLVLTGSSESEKCALNDGYLAFENCEK